MLELMLKKKTSQMKEMIRMKEEYGEYKREETNIKRRFLGKTRGRNSVKKPFQ